MDDVVDYSRKLNEERKKQKKFWLIVALIVTIISFSIGFYASYVFNDNEKENGYRNKLDTIYSTSNLSFIKSTALIAK